MNAPVQSNTKAQLLQNVVEHIDITAFDARPIIDSMRKMSFSSLIPREGRASAGPCWTWAQATADRSARRV